MRLQIAAGFDGKFSYTYKNLRQIAGGFDLFCFVGWFFGFARVLFQKIADLGEKLFRRGSRILFGFRFFLFFVDYLVLCTEHDLQQSETIRKSSTV